MAYIPPTGSNKIPLDQMTKEDWERAGEAARQRAKDKAFAFGLPIYYSENEQLYAEYPDGHIEMIDRRTPCIFACMTNTERNKLLDELAKELLMLKWGNKYATDNTVYKGDIWDRAIYACVEKVLEQKKA
jgi:hypothetical protein